MKKLVKIRLINWHYISNETININGNTILTGQNASGKSTIMDALTFVLTAGDTQFNLAANEKGKRDLRGYVKCKLGIDDKEYLRNGDVTGHIAVEFYDEKTATTFTVGAVIDAFGDLAPVKTLFYRTYEPIMDEMFVSNGKILSTVDFRKHNQLFEYYLTKKEAKKGFRHAFGSISEDFYRLLPKALAFKPISDVKDFIYQNILEEKEIDVTAIKDSIRSYKELEITLNLIKAKIQDLKEIDDIYQELSKLENDKNYIEYLMHLFDVEEIKGEIEGSRRQIEIEEEKKLSKEQAIIQLDQEILSLQERSRELYNLLSSNDTFKAEEYINREIIKVRTNISQLESNNQMFVKRAALFKDVLNEIRKLDKSQIFADAANINLTLINEQAVEQNKIKLSDYQTRFQAIKNQANQKLGSLNTAKGESIQKINEISSAVNNLEQNKVNFPSALVAMKNEIQDGLRRIYNNDIIVHIFAELCEITDQKWADTIEIFLGNRIFNLIVEPRYFDQAIQIYSRIKDRYKLYGIGLVNTKQIAKYTTCEKNSLATIIESENKDAQAFINYTCGNVIMCNDAMELEKYSTSITNDLLIYRGYTVSSLNPNVEKPFMGKNAASKASQIWKEKAIEARNEYVEISDKITEVERLISLYEKLDTRQLIDDLTGALSLKNNKIKLEDLERQSERQKNASPSELQQDYENVLEAIKENDYKKQQLSKEIGGIVNNIETLNEQIANKQIELAELEQNLKDLSNGSIVVENRALEEYKAIASSNRIKECIADNKARFLSIESSFTSLSDALLAKQFAFINKYNSSYSIGLSEIGKFTTELYKLEKSELVKYEQKVRDARESAELVFKEDFIAKLRNNILTAEVEIGRINETLANIKFGRDKYEFIFPRSSEYASFYDMVTSDLVDGTQ
ncbi:MAG: AAA family ATPase, partial [Acholeplasmatales bacterium]|nr:AAA family ATPase [Acholeplasmatales bacterium]